MIHASNLRKVFRVRRNGRMWAPTWETKVAVDSVTLNILPGHVTGLLGLNGAGKTTSIKMLSTLLIPSSGTAKIDGLDVVTESNRVRRMINVIGSGDRALYGKLTGRENLWYFGQLYDVKTSVLRTRIGELLELVGMTTAADVPVEQCSRGMKQRLQFARGLINAPRYLFLDEPTLGLDASIARQMRQMVRDLAEQQGRGVLLTSHYMAEVDELCSYIYLLDRGRVIAEGSPAGIRRRARLTRVIRAILAGEPLQDEFERILCKHLSPEMQVSLQTSDSQMEVSVQGPGDATAAVIEVAVGMGYRVVRVESVEPSLEDAILALADGARPNGAHVVDATPPTLR